MDAPGNNPTTSSAPTSPLRGRANPDLGPTRSRYGGLFRSTKSCANLEGMNPPKQSEPDHLPTLKESTPGFLSRSLFRSVKSCINLEGMDQPAAVNLPEHTEPNKDTPSSGILFSSLKQFKVKSNMVSERDINLMAPMSS